MEAPLNRSYEVLSAQFPEPVYLEPQTLAFLPVLSTTPQKKYRIFDAAALGKKDARVSFGMIPVYPVSTESEDGATLLWRIPERSAAAFLAVMATEYSLVAKAPDSDTLRLLATQIIHQLRRLYQPPLNFTFSGPGKMQAIAVLDTPKLQGTFNALLLSHCSIMSISTTCCSEARGNSPAEGSGRRSGPMAVWAELHVQQRDYPGNWPKCTKTLVPESTPARAPLILTYLCEYADVDFAGCARGPRHSLPICLPRGNWQSRPLGYRIRGW